MLHSSARILDDELRHLNLEPSLASAPAATSVLDNRPATIRRNATTQAESLPADDGMAHLRARIHEIRAMNITDQERARMVHSLMTERYNYMRPTSPSSFISQDRPFTPNSGHSVFSEAQPSSPVSAASDFDPENPYRLRTGDTDPTYRPQVHRGTIDHGEDEEEDSSEGELALGCVHYKRNVKVQCFECQHWYTCRHCHDAVESHHLNRKQTQNMLCMACGTPQKAADHCKNCQLEAACYYCEVCKLWDNNSKKKIYHCPDCGICRRGEGLGKDFQHCKKCNVCIAISHVTSHKCHPGAMENDCPICSDYLFTSSTAVVSMPCGHYLHKDCYNLYMETAYKCPICKKSAVSMELQWRKLTHAIESQPMPEQFSNTRAIIQCNDCSAKSSVKYHWLGNQCGTCESYNTNELRILNGPESEEAANAILDADENAGSRSPVSFPGMPQFPQMPGFPQIPQFPQMPQMPEAAQELLERVRQSMDKYLNPTGDIRTEDVPFIDLTDDDRHERQATDGTTVKEPSLPQYVVERFTQSLARFRDDFNPGMVDEIPNLDIAEEHDPSWEPGRQVNDEDEESSSSDESEHEEEEDDDDDDEDTHRKGTEFDLPGHR
ncbi:zf-CHY-domain-containing protein [Setomelanomma holmii]|uniref:Zf-CHY-domain-containing protein n=1 Tax=Setomelanomma holmii TaxID=210430 RepID=A0A9P4HI11_9PLEO|nr:zf-CHY-domain-containing protein [Setomelanomma holmii]